MIPVLSPAARSLARLLQHVLSQPPCAFASLLLCLLFWSSAVETKVFATNLSHRVINTQYGKLRGVLVTLPNRHLSLVEAYLGLQYASVLGGELRFMPPTSPMETWDGTRVALKFRPVCPQRIPEDEELRRRLPLGRAQHFERLKPFLERQSEECLNLNVYVPVRSKWRLFPF